MDRSGRIVGDGVYDLDDLTRADWRLGDHHVWSVERALIEAPQRRLRTSDRSYRRALRGAGALAPGAAPLMRRLPAAGNFPGS